MSALSILLKGRSALIHGANKHIVETKTSILIKNNRIAAIGPALEEGNNVKIIDCTNKSISPGFIDTHHHGWQTPLNGRYANEQLQEYMVTSQSC